MPATYLILVKSTSTFMGMELHMSYEIHINMNIIWHEIHNMNINWNEIGNNIPPLITTHPLLILSTSKGSSKSFTLHKYIQNKYNPYLYHHVMV